MTLAREIVFGYLVFCGVCCTIGALRLCYAALSRWWRGRQKRKYDEAVTGLIAHMRELCPTDWLFNQMRETILDNAYGEREKPYSIRIEEILDEAVARFDWRSPKSALAWGIIHREEGKRGLAIEVQAANNHVIMDTTEWWMLQETRREWFKSPGGFSEMYGNGPCRLMDAWTPEEREGLKHYGLKDVAAHYLARGGSLPSSEEIAAAIERARKRWGPPEYPCYQVYCHLGKTVWTWSNERWDWVETEGFCPYAFWNQP